MIPFVNKSCKSVLGLRRITLKLSDGMKMRALAVPPSIRGLLSKNLKLK
jgi:hypothetical protein